MLSKDKIKSSFKQTNTDKDIVHGYDRVYYQIFKDYTPNSLLEIGVYKGDSLASWRLLFPNIELSGIDVTDTNFNKKIIEFSDSNIIIGDSTNKEILNLVDKSYDVIIDDGSHFYKDIIKTFLNFKDKFNHMYVIEDCMYKQKFLIKLIKRLGFNNVKIYPSNVKNILVNKGWLSTNKYCHDKKIKINLYIIIIYKN